MKNSISKLIIGTITEQELIDLKVWLEEPKNQSILEEYVKEYYDINLATLKVDVDEAYKKLLAKIDAKEVPVKSLFNHRMKYGSVAAAVLIFIMTFIAQQLYFSDNNDIPIIQKEEAITLELDNGEIRVIDVLQSKALKDKNGKIIGIQNQEQLEYKNTNGKESLSFNTLSIPFGKRFNLHLSDGTRITLNSGSSLRYPMNFSQLGPREVFLQGEAYFDVFTDQSRPFIVKIDDLEVKVLGTEFNVSAYSDDVHYDVVLVEGSVALNLKDRPIPDVELLSGQMGSFHIEKNTIDIESVNTILYTSWMNGHMVFREVKFEEIVKKLQRYYNVEIIIANPEVGKEVFNASFNNVTIMEVLSFFSETHKINYSISDNKIVIN